MAGRGKDTEYRGVLFRSRLEARWAVFFDAVGERWSYEARDFVLKNGVRYLPDFCLYDYHVQGMDIRSGHLWCEVKGGMITELDMEKITGMYEMGEPVLVLGDIPKGNTFEDIINEIPEAAYGSDQRYGKTDICPFNSLTMNGDFFGVIPCAKRSGGLILPGDDCSYLCDEAVDREKTVEAYRKARQARFEFGETPDGSRL